MLLLHQAGSVKVGELVRYTLTYTPTNDRILPTPTHLHLKIKNTSAIPLRAAWLHGPYVLHVAAYPSTFNPHHRVEEPKRYGVPEYEPMLKAGTSWQAKLTVPDDIRETGADLGKRRRSMQSAQPDSTTEGRGSMTWIIEVTSQILFSTTASVNFEVLVGRDERSLELGFAAVAGHGHGAPGQIKDQESAKERKKARRQGNVQTAGVYSKAVRLVVEDTDTLWDKPPFPGTVEQVEKTDHKSIHRSSMDKDDVKEQSEKPAKKRKKVHLVVLTHGLHSNIGADLLFLKESIDATVKQARVDAKKRKESYRAERQTKPNSDAAAAAAAAPPTGGDHQPSGNDTSTAPLSGGQEDLENDADRSDNDDEEETIVRGFTGNALKTENGIQYLGKRLAKYILRFTYPDQPYLPIKKPLGRQLTDTFKSEDDKVKRDGPAAHHGSSVHHPKAVEHGHELPYTFTSISFVGHSLGGLIQTYAIAYIHKHSPTFFDQIKPVNFIALASPMLGLSNENPMYVKFALDFGLVGRTGQDLGLTWRPPTLARGGWNAMIGGFGAGQKEPKQEDPAAKPLLRILPTGPAHQVLHLFRNRTVYSNVVNDGIVPLRTSCLLFLDWKGLGKVDKARRENGLIGTVAEWGWAELTGANAGTPPPLGPNGRYGMDEDSDNEHVRKGEGEAVPLPAEDETARDNRLNASRVAYEDEINPFDEQSRSPSVSGSSVSKKQPQETGFFDNVMSFFRAGTQERVKTPPPTSKKTSKALRRGQVISHGGQESPEEAAGRQEGTTDNPVIRPGLDHKHSGQVHSKRPVATRGSSTTSETHGELQSPPKTSIFESAGDILHPPLPSRQWITDPASRTRTIFHDRVYHPEDIPPPPVRRSASKAARTMSVDGTSKTSAETGPSVSNPEIGTMKVEEKIARAYHRDLSWRKVLVRLEPDAHNNIIVRRMFANAYGWPVIKHLCDTHFGDTYAATTRDEDEPARERAPPLDAPVPPTGEEVADQTAKQPLKQTDSEMREARDELAGLEVAQEGAGGSYSSSMRGKLTRQNSDASTMWDDSFFEGSEEEESDVDERTLVARLMNPNVAVKKPAPALTKQSPKASGVGSSSGKSVPPTNAYADGHRGLAPTSPRSPASGKAAASVKAPHGSPPTDSTLVADQLTEEPAALEEMAASPTVLGLGKSVPEQAGAAAVTKTRDERPGSSSETT